MSPAIGMDPAGEQLSPEQLLELLRGDITDLLKNDVDEDLLPEKQRQNFRLDKANKYNRGLTYIAPDVNSANGTVTWSGVSTGTTSESDLEGAGLYDYNIDITKSYGRKYTAVLGTRPFYNMKGRPENPLSEQDRDAARQAEVAAQLCRAKWNIRIRNIEIFAKQWEAGNVYAYLNHSADEKVWGTYNEPQYEPKTVELSPAGYRCPGCGAKSPEPAMDDVGQASCPDCGGSLSDFHFEEAETTDVPEYVGDATYPHAGPKLTLCTGFTVTCPFDATADDFDDVPLLYEYECHKGMLLQYFGDDLRKFVDESGELKSGGTSGSIHEQGAQTRGSAASLRGVGGRQKRRWTFSRYWIPSSYFECIPDKAKRELLNRSYPKGLKVSQVEGNLVRLENEAKSDHWVCFTPEPGEYLYRDPQCWGILPLQDIKNDLWNLLVATIERGMPSHLMDPDVIDDEQIRNKSRMLEVLFSKPGAGRSLGDAIKTIPSASFPDGALPLIEGVDTNVQQHSGLLPAAWGGQSGNKTAEQARSDLNQALMQLSVPGEYATAGWVAVFTKAVKLMAEYGAKSMNVDGETLDFEVLRSGKWYFEGDPGVPMSWSEIQQRLDLVLGQNPEMAHAMGLDAPMNIGAMRDYVLPGMNDIRVPGEDNTDRILDRIREMLDQQPVSDGMQYQPSIMPDPDLDDPAADGDLLRQWLKGPQGRREEKLRPLGYANVKLHLAAMKQLGIQQQMEQQAQQQAPPPGPNNPPPNAPPPTERPGANPAAPPPQ